MTLLRAEWLAADIASTFRNESLILPWCYVTPKDKMLFTDVSRENIAVIFRKSKEVCHAGAYECNICYPGRKINKMKLNFPLSP